MNDKKIVHVKKIDSIILYKQIYRKCCNSFWSLRPTFFVSFLLGIVMLVIFFANIFNHKYMHAGTPLNLKNAGKIILPSIILCIPAVIVIYRLSRIKKRSRKYIKFLKEIKQMRSLNNQDIDELLEDINNLKDKYKIERNRIGKILLSVSKLVIFPVTAIIFKGTFNDMYIAGLGLVFILVPVISITIAAWDDFQSFEDLNKLVIKNYYLISVVETELIYMKKL